eukprot:TRINITY_DN26334_c0_g1_i1.p1 TRINITY_DN26334_c0_g1~~TRINITY_DN26334_c0_g1_i1.p1  ORF type:complete len:737 (-),score=122.22 TRINITY_DN26334_c0_g1_i1:129-2339(-)
MEHFENLDVRIGNLSSTIENTKTLIFDLISGESEAFKGTLQCSLDVATRIDDLKRTLDDLSGHPDLFQELEVADDESEKMNCQEHLNHLNIVTNSLDQIGSVWKVLSNFDLKVQSGAFIQCSVLLDDLESKFLLFNGTDVEQTKVYNMLKEHICKRKAQLKNIFRDIMSQSLSFEPKAIRIKSKLNGTFTHSHLKSPVTLAQILSLMRSQDWYAELGKGIVDGMKNMLLYFCSKDVSAKIDQDQSRGVMLICESVLNENYSKFDQAQRLLENVSLLFQFFCKFMMVSAAPDVCCKFGKDLLIGEDNVMQRLLSALRNALPEDSSGFASFKSLSTQAEEFEKLLSKHNFLSSDCAEASLLTRFIEDADFHFTEEKRATIITKARESVCNDFHSVVQVSTESIGPQFGDQDATMDLPDDAEGRSPTFPQCSVSLASRNLLQLMDSCFKEASEPSTSVDCSRALLQTARCLPSLYLSLCRTMHGADLRGPEGPDLRAAALFHNDCMYIAHHMATLGFLHKHRIRPEQRTLCATADLIVPLREAARFTLLALKHSQQRLFKKELQPFTRLVSHSSCDEVDEALSAVRQRIFSIYGVLRALLPSETLSNLMADFFGLIARSVLLWLFQGATSIEETRQVREEDKYFLNDFCARVVELENSLNNESKGVCGSEVVSQAPLWKKFTIISQLMCQPLPSIIEQCQLKTSGLDHQDIGMILRLLHREHKNFKEAILSIPMDSNQQ